MNRIKAIAKVVVIMGTLTSCSPPEAPSGLSDASTPKQKKATSLEFNAGGAKVGPDAETDEFKNCLGSKKFFDRKESKCTESNLAQVHCTQEKIKLALTDSQYEKYTSFFEPGQQLNGYQLDQCLDCPDPTKDALCKGKDSSPTQAGYRLFFVKLVGTNIQTLNWYVVKMK